VKHSVKDLAEGKEVILTLEDKNVLDENGDELANVNLKDLERARKNVKLRSKKLGYDAYEEEDEDDVSASGALLKQYDEVSNHFCSMHLIRILPWFHAFFHLVSLAFRM
jgi:U4/U6.U5 tri-snRNP-associated protein 1